MKIRYVIFTFLIFSSCSFSGELNMSHDPNELFGKGISLDEDPVSTANAFGLGEEELFDLAEKSKKGDKGAAYRLYEFYQFSMYDKDKASHWLIVAANLNHGTAQHTIALDFFEDGKYEKALSWCEKAIENGEVNARELLDEIKERL
jgi:TPR repeat protein